jgi:hypothetical protein
MNYNLSMYEIGFRYILAVLLIIPATMFRIMPLIVLAIFVMLTGLLGMCPIKAILSRNKKPVAKH